MFKSLIIKEIQSAIIDFRFWVVTILCLCIIPLNFYVSVKNYQQSIDDYQQEIQAYKKVWDGNINANFKAQGIHPPSSLSIFSRGIDDKMPNKTITSRDGQIAFSYPKPDTKQDMLGKIDFSFIVVFVLTILAITFTFSTISGDKENGTLRAVLSNAVLRRQILLSKLIGNYIVYIIPFLLSIFIALLIVYVQGVIPIFSSALFPYVLMLIGISMLLLFAFFNLGLWISSLTKSSILSINVLLLIWIVVGLVIPKISPIISEAIYPVESPSVFEMQKNYMRDNLIKEHRSVEGEIYEEIRNRLRPEANGISSGWEDVNKEYDEKVMPLREKHEENLASETSKLENDYKIRVGKQNRISQNISRLSLINCANNLLTEFSATGYSEHDNFLKQANQFQNTVKRTIYDNIILKQYFSKGGWASQTEVKDGFDPKTIAVPTMENYQFVSIAKILQNNWGDIVLLAFYALVFFVCAFISFLRFDVR